MTGYGFTDDVPTLEMIGKYVTSINDLQEARKEYIRVNAETPQRVRLNQEQIKALEREATLITGIKQKLYKGAPAYIADMEIIFDEMEGL